MDPIAIVLIVIAVVVIFIAGRTLRISGHPDSGRVVLSIWQDNVCRATLRLATEDVSEFVDLLTRTAQAPGDHSEARIPPLETAG
jgi:hypothetical protein